ncbi:hypothetical protein HKX48_001037 [Thoreauomyces humboldtii]|nr:hypothetical protein HKX48_001037 [Thoreauomyces humboldtii]
MPSWTLNPTFFEENGKLATEAAPDNLTLVETAKWVSGVLESLPTISISQSVRGVATQSLIAAVRYGILSPRSFNIRLALALLAETHFLLNDTYGALQTALRSQAILGRGVDVILDNAVKELTILASDDEGDDGDAEEESVLIVKEYKRPPTPVGVSAKMQDWKDVKDAWETLKKKEPQSWLYENSIAEIPRTSRIRTPAKIVRILKNTEACFSNLSEVLGNSHEYSHKLITGMHGRLLQDDNIEYEDYGDGEVAVLIPRGVYRRVACYTSHESKGYETRFCRWSAIKDEMNWYLEVAAEVLDDQSIDPFLAAAWLQFAFLRIHPFADGNGRVSRFISSIPLLQAGLPPCIVSPDRKDAYFDALDHADTSGNCSMLAGYLRDEIMRAMDELAGPAGLWDSASEDKLREGDPFGLNTSSPLRALLETSLGDAVAGLSGTHGLVPSPFRQPKSLQRETR